MTGLYDIYNIPGVMNFPCLRACLMCCFLMSFFLFFFFLLVACFVVRDLCRSGCVDRITIFSKVNTKCLTSGTGS